MVAQRSQIADLNCHPTPRRVIPANLCANIEIYKLYAICYRRQYGCTIYLHSRLSSGLRKKTLRGVKWCDSGALQSFKATHWNWQQLTARTWFLLLANSNVNHTLHRFRDIATKLQNQTFLPNHAVSLNNPIWGNPSLTAVWSRRKLEPLTKLCDPMFTCLDSLPACDRQTDERRRS